MCGSRWRRSSRIRICRVISCNVEAWPCQCCRFVEHRSLFAMERLSRRMWFAFVLLCLLADPGYARFEPDLMNADSVSFMDIADGLGSHHSGWVLNAYGESAVSGASGACVRPKSSTRASRNDAGGEDSRWEARHEMGTVILESPTSPARGGKRSRRCDGVRLCSVCS